LIILNVITILCELINKNNESSVQVLTNTMIWLFHQCMPMLQVGWMTNTFLYQETNARSECG